jgi:undecaprenyl-phosphate galactose phosphotransferase
MSTRKEIVYSLIAQECEAAARRRWRSLRGLSLKRIFDILGGLVLGLVFLPVFLPYCIAVKLSGHPVFFSQMRIGRNGRPFRCYKFRTMVVNADAVLEELLERDPEARQEWASCHKLRDDPRITRAGRLLRRTSLDELPQLWNVLKGDMSLVGPRPVVYEEVPRYGRRARDYLAVRPGMTGLWQVSGRNDTGYRRRVAMDVWYVKHQSLPLDCLILLKTVSVVVSARGAY